MIFRNLALKTDLQTTLAINDDSLALAVETAFHYSRPASNFSF
jgi:hypothetical protein